MNFEPKFPESCVTTQSDDSKRGSRRPPLHEVWAMETVTELAARRDVALRAGDTLVAITRWYAGGDKTETIYVTASWIKAIEPYS